MRWLPIHSPGQFAIVFDLAFTAAGRFRHPASHWSTCGKPAKLTLPIRAGVPVRNRSGSPSRAQRKLEHGLRHRRPKTAYHSRFAGRTSTQSSGSAQSIDSIRRARVALSYIKAAWRALRHSEIEQNFGNESRAAGFTPIFGHEDCLALD